MPTPVHPNRWFCCTVITGILAALLSACGTATLPAAVLPTESRATALVPPTVPAHDRTPVATTATPMTAPTAHAAISTSVPSPPAFTPPPYLGIPIQLDAAKLGGVGQTVTFLATVTATMILTDTVVSFGFPNQVTLLDGSRMQRVTLRANQPATFSFTVRMNAVGLYRFDAGAQFKGPYEGAYGGHSSLFLLVGTDTTTVSREPPPGYTH